MFIVNVAPFKYSTDLSLRLIQEINATIDQFTYNIFKIQKEGYSIYIQKPEQEVSPNPNSRVCRVSIDALELVIVYNPFTGTISLEAFANVPIIGLVSINHISGSLTGGINLSLGYPGILSGSVGIKPGDSTVLLSYSFTARSSSFIDEIELFKA